MATGRVFPSPAWPPARVPAPCGGAVSFFPRQAREIHLLNSAAAQDHGQSPGRRTALPLPCCARRAVLPRAGSSSSPGPSLQGS